MSETSRIPSEQNGYDGEISISELLMKLWAKRGIIFFLPLALACLTIAGLLLTKATSTEKLSYYIELTGLKDNAYPNGTAFSPQDLLNPLVTRDITLQFAIKDGVNIADFVVVDFGSPLSAGVVAEYRTALNENSKASSTELALINERYRDRLRVTARRGIRIEVDYQGLGLSRAQGIELSYALPRTWSKIFSSRFRIFVDAGVMSLTKTNFDLDISSIVGTMEANIELDTIKKSTSILKADSRYRALEADGVSPGDLAREIDNFKLLYFDPIYSITLGDDELSSIYRRDLLLQLTELEASIEELNNRILAITELQGTASTSSAGSKDLNNGSSQVQIESDALNQLLTLSRTASLSEYLQSSFHQRADLISRKARINTQLQKMGSGNTDRAIFDDSFVANTTARFIYIKESYNQLLSAAQQAAVAETPSLYEVATEVQGTPLLERRDYLFIAFAIALGGALAIIAALIWPQRQAK